MRETGRRRITNVGILKLPGERVTSAFEDLGFGSSTGSFDYQSVKERYVVDRKSIPALNESNRQEVLKRMTIVGN
jgi:hypothetical protein